MRTINAPIFVHSDVDDAGLNPSQFRVYGHVARRAQGEGVCLEGAPKMAAHCQLHADTVRASLKELLRRRMLKVHERPGKTWGYSLTAPGTWLTLPKIREGSERETTAQDEASNPPENQGGVEAATPPKKREGSDGKEGLTPPLFSPSTPPLFSGDTPPKIRETKILSEDTPSKILLLASEPAAAEAGKKDQPQKSAESQKPATSAAAKPKAKAVKSEQPADPRFKPFTDGYCLAYREVFGTPYVHGGGKDGKRLKDFLSSANPQEFNADWLVDMARMAMQRSREPFPDAAKFATTIFGFCEHFNPIQAKIKTPVEARRLNGHNHHDNEQVASIGYKRCL